MQSQPSQSPAVCGCPWHLLPFPLVPHINFLHSFSMGSGEGHGMPKLFRHLHHSRRLPGL